MPKRQLPRNRHAYHPIMRKGGAHQKSNGAKRAAAKREVHRKTNEWFSRSKFIIKIAVKKICG